MIDFKSKIKLELTANIIRDWLKQISDQRTIYFSDADCSYTTFPFATSVRSSLLNDERNIRYEIFSDENNFYVRLTINQEKLHAPDEDIIKKLTYALDKTNLYSQDASVLCSWDISRLYPDTADRLKALQLFFEIELAYFEKELAIWKNDNSYTIKTFPDVTYTEGKGLQYSAEKYERNRLARKKCISIHGTACAVCGFDFGNFYGDSFRGKIEVHHIKPLSKIKEEYEVNPRTDLIPLCPNCHTAIHSKPNGVYTVDELKELIKNKN